MSSRSPRPSMLISAGITLAIVSAAALLAAPLLQTSDDPAPASASFRAPEPAPAVPAPSSEPSGPPPSVATSPPPEHADVPDPASVAGAYQAAGNWWVDCASPHAVQPQQFEYGCAIIGHEPQAGTLLSDQPASPEATPADIDAATELLLAWIPYDSTSAPAWEAANADPALPASPALSWPRKAAEFAATGFRAVVDVAGEPRLIATTAGSDGLHLTFSVPVSATYTIAQSCLPLDVAGPGDETCTLATLDEPLLWTVVVDGGTVRQLIEPAPFEPA